MDKGFVVDEFIGFCRLYLVVENQNSAKTIGIDDLRRLIFRFCQGDLTLSPMKNDPMLIFTVEKPLILVT